MLQQYARTYGIDLDTAPPLPSTLKAALIQTATDLVDTVNDPHDWINPDTDADVRYHAGPDYATGYGLVNALAAVGIIKEKKLLENSIAARSEVDNHEFLVASGTDRIQFTLAWDDEAYEGVYVPDTESRLVNDLEFSLIAPDGTEHLAMGARATHAGGNPRRFRPGRTGGYHALPRRARSSQQRRADRGG